MKHIFTVFLFLLFSQAGSAQTDFADSGASWYYNMSFGSFHYKVTGYDTVQGIRASIIEAEALVREPWFSQGLRVNDHGVTKIYATADTVFIFNSFFNRFTPLYVFNVAEGDTVCIPMLSAILDGNATDSNFCFVVDSIRIRQYDTANLRTFYTRHLNLNGNEYIENWGWDTLGAYAERIGGLYTGLTPACLNCPEPQDERFQSPGSIRCYTDKDYTLKLASGPCDNDGISKSVARLREEHRPITIAPVPAHDHIRIITDEPEDVLRVIVTDMQGRIVTIADKPGSSSISVQDLPQGIYLLRVHLKERDHVQKLVIQRR